MTDNGDSDNPKSFQTAVGSQDAVAGQGDVYGRYTIGKVIFDQVPGKSPEIYELAKDHGIVLMMTPAMFLKLSGGAQEVSESKADEIAKAMEEQTPFVVPYLKVNFGRGPLSIIEHEGRHRCAAVEKLHPSSLVPVYVFPEGGGIRRFEPTVQHLSALCSEIIGQDGSTIYPDFSTALIKGERYDCSGQQQQQPRWRRWLGM